MFMSVGRSLDGCFRWGWDQNCWVGGCGGGKEVIRLIQQYEGYVFAKTKCMDLWRIL